MTDYKIYLKYPWEKSRFHWFWHRCIKCYIFNSHWYSRWEWRDMKGRWECMICGYKRPYDK